MTVVFILGDTKAIELGAIEPASDSDQSFFGALGLCYMNFGRLEQTLEILLRYTDDPRFVTGQLPKFPDISFRLKIDLFKRLYTKHPRFCDFQEQAKGIVIGLTKANKARVAIVHSNFQGIEPGPPPAMKAVILKFKGANLQTFDGTWAIREIEDFNELLCRLNNDLSSIFKRVVDPDFLQSLERPLSRIQKATLAWQRILSRLPRLRIERPFPPV